jgi:hypothetical protein
MTSEASSYDMDFNQWTNECISVSEAGDICAIKSKQLLINVVTKQLWSSRLVFGYTDVVHLGEEQVANHLNEDYKYNDDSGIVFCDLDRVRICFLLEMKKYILEYKIKFLNYRRKTTRWLV